MDKHFSVENSSNNTNKLSPQELGVYLTLNIVSSNNTNKLSPQEHPFPIIYIYAEFK